jgi:two-component system sensor histidine kinase AgrC
MSLKLLGGVMFFLECFKEVGISVLFIINLFTIDLFIIHFYMFKTILKEYKAFLLLCLSNFFRLMIILLLYNYFPLTFREIYLIIMFCSPFIWATEFLLLFKLTKNYFPPLMIIVTNLVMLQLSFTFLDLFVFFRDTASNLYFNVVAYSQPVLLSLLLFLHHKFNSKFKILFHLLHLRKKYKLYSLIGFGSFSIVFGYHMLSEHSKENFNIYVYTSLLTYISLIFLYMLLNITLRQRQENNQLRMQAQKAFRMNEQLTLAQEFRHDYKAILISLSESLAQENLQAAKQQLNDIIDYSKPVIESFYGEQLAKMQLPTIQFLLYDFLQRCEEHGIQTKVSINKEITDVAMNIIDLSRCISILCNNSFEAVMNSPAASIELLISHSENQFTFSIKNTVTEPVNLMAAMKKGMTTKKMHQGYGLFIFVKTLSKYSNTHYFFDNEKDYFTASFSILHK